MRVFQYISNVTLLVVTSAALSACVTGPRVDKAVAAFDSDPRLGERVESACFTRQIDGFSQNTRDTVVLSFGVNDDYLVTINNICPSLRNARSIAPIRTTSCLREGSELIVSESSFSLGRNNGISNNRCRIDNIYRWNEDAKAQDLSDQDTADIDAETASK